MRGKFFGCVMHPFFPWTAASFAIKVSAICIRFAKRERRDGGRERGTREAGGLWFIVSAAALLRRSTCSVRFCCATLRSNFQFHRRIMNRYANPRIGIITHSCDIVFSHAVNRTCFAGPTRHGATRDDARPGEEDKDTEDRPRQLQAHACIRIYARDDIQYKDAEKKIPVKLTWNMWHRVRVKNIGPLPSLLNARRARARSPLMTGFSSCVLSSATLLHYGFSVNWTNRFIYWRLEELSYIYIYEQVCWKKR